MSQQQNTVIFATWLLLGLFMMAAWFNWSWPSGVLFLWFGIHGLTQGQTFMLSPLLRQDNPKTYWVVVLAWFVFGILSIGVDVASLWSNQVPS